MDARLWLLNDWWNELAHSSCRARREPCLKPDKLSRSRPLRHETRGSSSFKGLGTTVALSKLMSDAPKKPAAGRAGTKKELPEHLKAYRHVWVFIEYEHGAIHTVSLELLGEGRKLADKLGVELGAVIIGGERSALASAASQCFELGADVAYLAASPLLASYRNEPYTKVMTELVNAHKPEILLLGATNLGRDLAGAVATTLLTGLTADCTALALSLIHI